MRAPYPASAALLPILIALPVLTAGCGDAAKKADAAAVPAISKERAQAVLTDYSAVIAKASKALDPDLLATVETGSQLTMDVAAYKLHLTTKKPLTPFAFTDPKFYIPRLQGYPRWFAVDTRSTTGETKIQHALLFVQDAANAPWKVAADPQRRDGGPINGLAVDAEGYARAASDTGRPLRPAGLAEAHAALLSSGPKVPAAAGIAPGPLTTKTYDLLQKVKTQLTQNKLTFTTRFSAVSGQTYALQTTDGGAVVWYVLQQEESYEGGRVPIHGDLIGLAPKGEATSLTSTTLIQYLASIPAKGDATVSGATRKAVAAETS